MNCLLKILLAGSVFPFLLSAGCASPVQDWKKARSSDTIDAYETFLQQYPSGEYTEQARSRLAEIRLQMPAWNQAQNQNTIRAYQTFLSKYPYGPLSEKARAKIVDLEVASILGGKPGTLPPAQRISGGGNRTYSVVNIHNNTTYTLTVWYSGPDSFKVSFAPGGKGSVEVLKGDYQVAASVDAPHVQNYAGRTSSDGGNYQVEFYIVQMTSSGIPLTMPPAPSMITQFQPWKKIRSVPDHLK